MSTLSRMCKQTGSCSWWLAGRKENTVQVEKQPLHVPAHFAICGFYWLNNCQIFFRVVQGVSRTLLRRTVVYQ